MIRTSESSGLEESRQRTSILKMTKGNIIDLPAGVAVEELGEGGTISDDDATLLALGKKPELRRVHSFWSCMSSS
jgi:hypothetical protein